jgi:hypothetical protein
MNNQQVTAERNQYQATTPDKYAVARKVLLNLLMGQ